MIFLLSACAYAVLSEYTHLKSSVTYRYDLERFYPAGSTISVEIENAATDLIIGFARQKEIIREEQYFNIDKYCETSSSMKIAECQEHISANLTNVVTLVPKETTSYVPFFAICGHHTSTFLFKIDAVEAPQPHTNTTAFICAGCFLLLRFFILLCAVIDKTTNGKSGNPLSTAVIVMLSLYTLFAAIQTIMCYLGVLVYMSWMWTLSRLLAVASTLLVIQLAVSGVGIVTPMYLFKPVFFKWHWLWIIVLAASMSVFPGLSYMKESLRYLEKVGVIMTFALMCVSFAILRYWRKQGEEHARRAIEEGDAPVRGHRQRRFLERAYLIPLIYYTLEIIWLYAKAWYGSGILQEVLCCVADLCVCLVSVTRFRYGSGNSRILADDDLLSDSQSMENTERNNGLEQHRLFQEE